MEERFFVCYPVILHHDSDTGGGSYETRACISGDRE